MKRIGWVLAKELLDNFRDRRTLITGVLIAPWAGPLLILGITIVQAHRLQAGPSGPLVLAVKGGERVPDLLARLRKAGVLVVDAAGEPQRVVRRRQAHAVLVVTPKDPAPVRALLPLRLALIVDLSDEASRRAGQQVRHLLDDYGVELASRRLAARGIDPDLARPLEVIAIDVSTPRSRALLLSGMIPYFIFMAVLLSGFYLAIDTTAGERERGSLEPLLTTAASRDELLAGKLLATCTYSILGLLLVVLAFRVGLSLAPLGKLGMALAFGPRTMAAIVLLYLPFALFASALLTVVASFARSFKEAQTYLSLVLLLPFAVMVFAVLATSRPAFWILLLPNLSQHLLATSLLQGSSVGLAALVLSWAGTCGCAAGLAWLALRLWRRESLLG